MNRTLCTINIGGFLRQNIRESFLAACERWGCDYFEIDETVTDKPHFIDIKLDMCRFPQLAGKRVMFIDADAVIREDCPSPWDWVAPGYFAGVQNDQGFLDQVCQYNQFKAWNVNKEFLSEDVPYIGWCINTGMFLYEPDVHAGLFDMATQLYRHTKPLGGDEQIGLSVCIMALQTPFYPLPRPFNCVGPITFETWPKLPAWVTHYAKYGKHRRENTAELLDAAEWRRVQCCVQTG